MRHMHAIRRLHHIPMRQRASVGKRDRIAMPAQATPRSRNASIALTIAGSGALPQTSRRDAWTMRTVQFRRVCVL
ncbi:hypothetical protein ASE79_18575 [Sphingomonas sp. Leaf28]|nr:hypothetical protein ASE79_18575 [Sphingomonas sp. Leaf28]